MGPGRIVTTIISTGIVLLFHHPKYYYPVDVDLVPEQSPDRRAKLREMHEKGLLTDEEFERLMLGGSRGRMERIERMFEEGLLTDEEFEQLKLLHQAE
jgi:hypothetical protein